MQRRWDTWVEIHPQTAEQQGIGDGQRVVVSTPRGAMELRAKISAGVMPGVLAVPFGFGHEYEGRWVARGGGNPARIVVPQEDPIAGAPFWNDTPASMAAI